VVSRPAKESTCVVWCNTSPRTFHGLCHVISGEELRACGGVGLIALQTARALVAPRAAVLGQLPRAHAAYDAQLVSPEVQGVRPGGRANSWSAHLANGRGGVI